MSRWVPDILAGYESTEIALPDAARAAGEPIDADLVATLIRRLPRGQSRAAVLYLHGWNDYFFQTHLADRLVSCGLDFYALDLRRYGRSLRSGQLPGYITDLDEYDQELGRAADVIAADHDSLLVLGHSTGGLIAALWAARHPDRVRALILNSPWLDVQRAATFLRVGARMIDRMTTRAPTSPIPLPDLGISVRNMHRSYGGEWDYDLQLKTTPAPPVRLGWLRAIRLGQARVFTGLHLTMPVLVLLSARTKYARTWHEGLRTVDTVVDVDRIAHRSLELGWHVTVVRLEGAMHDVVLSAAPVRERALLELGRWCSAYGQSGASRLEQMSQNSAESGSFGNRPPEPE